MANYSVELCHHGMKGQKWGERQVPWYPIDAYKKHLKESGYSNESINKIMGRVNSGASDNSIKRMVKKQTRKMEKEQAAKKAETAKRMEALRQAKAKKEQEAKEKSDAISTGNMYYISANRDKLTSEEIKSAEERYKVNKSIDDMIKERDSEADREKTQKMLNNLDTLNSVADKMARGLENGTKVYNSVAKIANAFGDKNLPIIGEKRQDAPKPVTDVQNKYDKDGNLTYTKEIVTDSNGNRVTTERQFKDQGNDKKNKQEDNKKDSKKQTDQKKAQGNDNKNQKKAQVNDNKQDSKDNSESNNKPKTQSSSGEKYIKEYEAERAYQEQRAKEKKEAEASPSMNWSLSGASNMDQLNKKYAATSSTLGSLYKSGKITEAKYQKEIRSLISEFDTQRGKLR